MRSVFAARSLLVLVLMSLVLGSSTYAIDLTSYGNNLEGLRDAIDRKSVV